MELIIFAIIAGIISMIGNQKKKGEQQQQPNQKQQPRQQQQHKTAQTSKQRPKTQSSSSRSSQPRTERSGTDRGSSNRGDRIKNVRDAFDKRAKELAAEYERHRSDMESAKPKTPQLQVEVVEDPSPDFSRESDLSRTDRGSSASKKKTKPYQEVKELPIKNGLSEKDLVNGIVLAEILGPPRSKKPRSHRHTR
ncbi:hypothetical protein [Jeotgalibacillus proteolyticus]|uniref:Uncharacterized protein n=1 Tax=Jeotgalibacillus proteolyticus TaxID=2082395 RepID=A0A2S5GEX0_9BACL|nr:hypothetical protein [Jeotgalibacillus proteolyticus]PPA71454.1 hypothetical protein C4B60_05170 [Jeotgalibacillus proteolyticus]